MSELTIEEQLDECAGDVRELVESINKYFVTFKDEINRLGGHLAEANKDKGDLHNLFTKSQDQLFGTTSALAQAEKDVIKLKTELANTAAGAVMSEWLPFEDMYNIRALRGVYELRNRDKDGENAVMVKENNLYYFIVENNGELAEYSEDAITGRYDGYKLIRAFPQDPKTTIPPDFTPITSKEQMLALPPGYYEAMTRGGKIDDTSILVKTVKDEYHMVCEDFSFSRIGRDGLKFQFSAYKLIRAFPLES